MKKLAVLAFIFFFALFLAAPLFAQEDMEDVMTPEEDIALMEESSEGVVTGMIADLNIGAGTISLKASDGAEKTFSVVDGETILWKGIEDIELSGISKGEEAEIGYYTDDSGKLIASWVDILIEETPAAGVSEAEEE
jgi:predicted RNA methylase